jgi:thiamine biosynthesis lipoprotein
LKKIVLTLLIVLFSCSVFSQQPYKRVVKLMGSRFDITVVAKDQKAADGYMDMAVEEITRIERLISSWDENSQTSEINRNAGTKAITVDKELYDLIERSLGISKLTDGAFDISYAAVDRIWKYDGSMTEMPTEEAIKASVQKVGYHHIKMDKTKHSVFLERAGMKIGFGAIGKGYAADKAKKLLLEKGVSAGIINASGDMNTWGRQPNGEVWKVAISNPMDKSKSYGLFPITDGAVVTSGNYEKYVSFNGKRYSHIIDPRTGYPASGLLSVTVFAPQAELADALATAVFVMGAEVGMHLINQISKVECIIVDEAGKISTSNNIKIEDL